MSSTQAHPTTHQPALVNALRQNAFELCAADRGDQACEVLDTALKLHPGHAELLGDLAALHLHGGRYEQSIQAARQALRAAPEHDESAYALAMALGANGQWAAAAELHRELADGARATRFARSHPPLAEHSRAEAARLAAAIAAATAPAPAAAPAAVPAAEAAPRATGSTRFTGIGPAKYQLNHLDQKADQDVGGPIQDDEALLMYALVRTMRLRRVLEVGGLSGYSARNFLTALGDETDAAVYTVDINPVASQAPNHFTLTKDCGKVMPDELHGRPLDLIFFDAHVVEPQLALLARLQQAGMVPPHAVIALHDTNLHPRKTAPWSYPITDSDGQTGHVHQAAERQMVNQLRGLGWDALCAHMDSARSDKRMPIRHGLTLMQRFRTLAT